MLKVILIALETYKNTIYILLYCSSSLLFLQQLTLKYCSHFCFNTQGCKNSIGYEIRKK